MQNESGTGRSGVACRLVLPDGRVVEFTMEGPLVAMAPAKDTTKERSSKRGAK
jgi:hypothetical protein